MARNILISSPNRRAALGLGAGAALLAAGFAYRRAGAGSLAADDGSPIRSFDAPEPAKLSALPGLLRQGPADA
ncbi:MAG: hypothetical protein ACK5JM_15400, partial [Rhodoblastus sp.]